MTAKPQPADLLAPLLALVAKLPSLETLDAVDDDLRSGTRPCPLHKLTINDVRLLHAFAAQRVEVAPVGYMDPKTLAALQQHDGPCQRVMIAGGKAVGRLCHPIYANPPQAQAGAGDGVALIAAERQRHMAVEGWTPEHDDEHAHNELATAAACYAAPELCGYEDDCGTKPRKAILGHWPWGVQWWKPGDRIRELVKAGALIAAEIDRLKRAALEASHASE